MKRRVPIHSLLEITSLPNIHSVVRKWIRAEVEIIITVRIGEKKAKGDKNVIHIDRGRNKTRS